MNLSQEFYKIMAFLTKSESECVRAGSKLASEDSAVLKFLHDQKKGLKQLEAIKTHQEDILADRKVKFESAKKNNEEFFKETANFYSVSNIEEAKNILSFKWQDLLILLFLIMEVLFTFLLAMEFYGDKTTENKVKALIWASGVLIGSYVLKKITPSLPTFTKFIYFVCFLITFGSSIFYIAKTTSGQDVFSLIASRDQRVRDAVGAERNIMLLEKTKNAEQMEREEMYFRLSILLCLIFAGLSLSCIIRNPEEEKDAQKIMQATKPYRLLESEINGYQDLLARMNANLGNHRMEDRELKQRGYSLYLTGVNSFWSRFSNSIANRKRKEGAVLDKINLLQSGGRSTGASLNEHLGV